MKDKIKNIEFLTKTQTAKNVFGECIFKGSKCFYKKFYNYDMYLKELKNNKVKYLQTPKLLFFRKTDLLLIYKNIENIKSKNLHYFLYSSQVTPTLNFLNYGFDKVSFVKENKCKNICFFKDRANIINNYFENIDELNCEFVVNNQAYNLKQILIGIFKNLMENKKLYSVISQGDPIDLNLLNDGTVIDLESAGKNSIVGEMAIFLNNILINGYSFFIKYAKSEYKNYIKDYENNKQRINFSYNQKDKQILCNLNLDIPQKNLDLSIQYLAKILNMYDCKVIDNINKYFKYYFAFRMLSPKNLLEMSKQDSICALAILCYFYTHTSSIQEFLKFLKKAK